MRNAIVYMSIVIFLTISSYLFLIKSNDMGNVTFVFFLLCSYVFALLPFIFVFKKANRKIWEALVPFYNVYVLGRIAKDKMYGWAFLIISGLAYLVAELLVYNDIIISIGAFVLSYIVQCVVYIALADRFNGGLDIKVLLCIPVINYFVLLYLGLSQKCVYGEFKGKKLEIDTGIKRAYSRSLNEIRKALKRPKK